MHSVLERVSKLKISIVKDYKAISEVTAKLVADYVSGNPECRLCLPTGGSVEGTYQELANLAKAENISFANVTAFNMDEYATLGKDNPNGYYYFMKKHLYEKIDINLENTNGLEGDAADLQEACRAYTKKVEDIGGFDFTLLGIGADGHIAFNMPADVYHMDTHLEDLSEETILANSRFFEEESQVPKQAITIGVGMIMNSKKIVLIASGKAKAKALASWLNNRTMTPHLPASILWLHPDVTVILDEDAASELNAR